MRDVRLLEPRDLLVAERELLGGERVLEVLGLRRADDRRGDAGLVQQPGERDLRGRDAASRGDLADAVDDGEVDLGRVEESPNGSVLARVSAARLRASRLPASSPRASGLQGITPTPWSMHCGIISRSSSR